MEKNPVSLVVGACVAEQRDGDGHMLLMVMVILLMVMVVLLIAKVILLMVMVILLMELVRSMVMAILICMFYHV